MVTVGGVLSVGNRDDQGPVQPEVRVDRVATEVRVREATQRQEQPDLAAAGLGPLQQRPLQ